MAFGYCGIRVDRFAPRLAASGDRRERYFQTANTPGGHRGMKRMKTNRPAASDAGGGTTGISPR